MKYGAMNSPIKPIISELKEIANLGFDYLELTMDAPETTPQKISAQKREISDSLSSYNFGLFGHLPRIAHLHAHDNFGKEDNHLPLGCGNIKFNEIFSEIKKTGYDDTLTLEVFSPDRDYLKLSLQKAKRIWGKL